MAGHDVTEYIRLIESFVKGELSAEDFESRYLAMFKADKTHRREDEFRVLDRLFADVDSFCADPSIRSTDELDEEELRSRCVEALTALRSLP